MRQQLDAVEGKLSPRKWSLWCICLFQVSEMPVKQIRWIMCFWMSVDTIGWHFSWYLMTCQLSVSSLSIVYWQICSLILNESESMKNFSLIYHHCDQELISIPSILSAGTMTEHQTILDKTPLLSACLKIYWQCMARFMPEGHWWWPILCQHLTKFLTEKESEDVFCYYRPLSLYFSTYFEPFRSLILYSVFIFSLGW